jgi:hypothetical protein
LGVIGKNEDGQYYGCYNYKGNQAPPQLFIHRLLQSNGLPFMGLAKLPAVCYFFFALSGNSGKFFLPPCRWSFIF